ncbi:MAG: FUN14 domain-containing protein [Halobacteria archaeon]
MLEMLPRVESLGTMGFNLGSGAFLGVVAGKVSRILLVIIAVFVATVYGSVLYLDNSGVVSVNQDRLVGTAENVSRMTQESVTPLMNTVLSSMAISGGFVAGFYYGVRS